MSNIDWNSWTDNSVNNKYISNYINLESEDDIIDFSKLNVYRYKIDMTIIIPEDKTNNIKSEEIEVGYNEITDFVVEHDYRDNFYPILRVSLVLKTYNCKKIQNNKNNIKFKIKFSKYKYDIEEIERNEEEVIFEDYFQPMFLNIIMDLTGEITNNELEDTSRESRRQLEIYLFNINHVNSNKTIINFIANKCTPKNAVGYILNQSNIKKVIMEIPTVTTEYSQILVPPKNFKNSIQTIGEQYGIFKHGFRQYLDFDRYYLLDNYINKKVPVEKGEYPNVYINVVRNYNSGKLKNGSYVSKENECYMINTYDDILANTYSSLEKEVIGSKLRVYERSELDNAMEYNEKNNTYTFKKGYKEQNLYSKGYNATLPTGNTINDKVKYVYNNSEIESNSTNIAMTTKYSNLEFTLSFMDIDVSIFTPNKRYLFKFQDINTAKLYNGVYMIEKLVYAYDCNKNSVFSMGKFIRIE